MRVAGNAVQFYSQGADFFAEDKVLFSDIIQQIFKIFSFFHQSSILLW